MAITEDIDDGNQGGVGSSRRVLGSRNLGANQEDPLFLSNSDHPGLQLVAAQFNGRNFHSWSRAVRMALGAKTKLGFINGKVEKPLEITDDYDLWLRCDFMVTSWIINSMKPELGENFMYVSSTKELWDEIQERFAESNVPLVYQLKKEISEIRQENMSVAEYYGKRKKAWDELIEIELIPICRCGNLKLCSCAILKQFLDREATNRLMQFLMGLSDSYEGIRSSILAMDPLPTVNRAFHMVLQIERQKGITGSLSQSHEVLAARNFGNNGAGSSRGNAGGNQGSASNGMGQWTGFDQRKEYMKEQYKKAKLELFCNYCKERGHIKDTCFKLVGFPDWYNGSKKNQNDKVVATVQDVMVEDTPLTTDTGSGIHFNSQGPSAGVPDTALVNVVVSEVLQAIKGKAPMDPSSRDGSMSFAGPFH